jgi:hypothetical protein
MDFLIEFTVHRIYIGFVDCLLFVGDLSAYYPLQSVGT